MKTDYLQSLPENWLPAAAVFSALGDEVRQKILLMFEPDEELSIKDIAERFPLSRTAIVHHLAVLERAEVLAVRRQGKMTLYSVRPKPVLAALNGLREYIIEVFPDTASEDDAS